MSDPSVLLVSFVGVQSVEELLVFLPVCVSRKGEVEVVHDLFGRRPVAGMSGCVPGWRVDHGTPGFLKKAWTPGSFCFCYIHLHSLQRILGLPCGSLGELFLSFFVQADAGYDRTGVFTFRFYDVSYKCYMDFALCNATF